MHLELSQHALRPLLQQCGICFERLRKLFADLLLQRSKQLPLGKLLAEEKGQRRLRDMQRDRGSFENREIPHQLKKLIIRGSVRDGEIRC